MLTQNDKMKRKPRITLPIKKSAKVDKFEPRWQFAIWYFLLTLLVLFGLLTLALLSLLFVLSLLALLTNIGHFRQARHSR